MICAGSTVVEVAGVLAGGVATSEVEHPASDRATRKKAVG